jgi:hypothetical protein
VWGSEFTSKGATLHGDSEEIAATPNGKLWFLVMRGGCMVVSCPFSGTAELNLLLKSILIFEKNFESSPKNLSREF